MGIKRRRRETAIADPGLHKRGDQILAAIFERPFFTRFPKKFLISAFPQKISSSISEKFLMTFFFFFILPQFFNPFFFPFSQKNFCFLLFPKKFIIFFPKNFCCFFFFF